MPIDRNLNPASYESGTDLADDISDTLNYIGGLSLGRLADVAGTNAIMASVAEPEGFSALTDGVVAILVPAADNTGAVTLVVNGGSPNPVYNNNGDALEDRDFKSGRAVPIQYTVADSGWRVLVDVPSQASVDASSDVPPYTLVDEVTSSGTWTAPWDCYVRIWLFGGGGSGNSGAASQSSGGGAATCIKDRFFMTSGQQLALTIGNGGAASGSGSPTGNSGGTSTCTGPNGLNMSAGGGARANGNTNGVGGTATGGDVNLNGSNGSNASTPGKSGLSRQFSSRIQAIGPLTASSTLPDGTAWVGTTSPSAAAAKGFAIIEYTTAIT